MSYFVYVLINPQHHIYIGQTNNVELRLIRHNEGLVRSTASYRPWKILFTEEYVSRSEAMTREKQLKSGKGREFIHKEVKRLAN